MRVSLDRMGNVVASGEGSFRQPMAVDQHDHALGDPVAVAENLRDRDWRAHQRQAQAERAQEARAQARHKKAMGEAEAARDYNEYCAEAMKAENAGEHPLMYLAVLQSMAGENRDYQVGISGYGLSTDGVPAYDRAMGHQRQMGGFFDDVMSSVTSIAQSVQAAATPVVETIQMVTGPSPQQIAADAAKAQATAQAQALALQLQNTPSGTVLQTPVTAGKTSLSSIMNMKLGPVPLPLVLGGMAALGLVLLLRRKPAHAV